MLARFRHRRRMQDQEAGMTLIELLVVVAILPMIIGAVAAAIVTALSNGTAVSNRLVDSANGQIASAYFVRDIHGATLVTTEQNVASAAYTGPFSSTNPQICGTPSGGGSLPNATLLLAVFRYIGSSANAVTYSLYTGASSPEILRQYCTVSDSITGVYSSTLVGSDLISDDAATATQLAAVVTPSAFGAAAATGWTATNVNAAVSVNFSNNSTTLALPLTTATTIPVSPAPSHFVASVALQVATTSGSQVVLTCTGVDVTGSELTGCTSSASASGSISQGALISQRAAVSGIALTSTQPKSTYTFNLVADPRDGTGAGGNGCNAGCGKGPALVTLGGGATIGLSGNASVDVNGSVALDSGTMTCNNNSSFSASGGIETTNGGNGSSSANCTLNPPVSAWGTGTVQDPYASVLPSFPRYPLSSRYTTTCCNSTVTLQPGEYLNQWSLTSSADVTLTPGVYVLDCGLSMTASNSKLQVASTIDNSGVLLYIPDETLDGYNPNCNNGGTGVTDHNNGNIKVTGGSLNLLPLTASQSEAFFSTAADPGAAGGLWLWQHGTDTDGTVTGNSNAATLGGSGAVITISGTAYLPAADVTLDGTGGLTIGRVIAKSIGFTGTSVTNVTGQ